MAIKVPKKVKKVIAGFVASAVFAALIIVFGNTHDNVSETTLNSAQSMENLFYDLYFKASTSIEEYLGSSNEKVKTAGDYDRGILIADIDEPALAKLGNYNEWDRSIHARVVENLSKGGASAIGFDILFKNGDFGKLKADQVQEILQDIGTRQQDIGWDSIYPKIRAAYNYDSMLVTAIQNSGNVIVSCMFDETKSYKHESQWRPLSGEMRAQELGLHFVFNNSQVDSIEDIEPKDLLDNVFPELARAGKFVGAVNAYPDKDGVVRRVSMLYRFPNPEMDTTTDDDPEIRAVSRIDSSRVYSTLSMMTLLHLFHQDPKNVEIKVGKYINLGKPFGIYRDSLGHYQTTYPHFSYPMFLALREKLKEPKIQKRATTDFIDVSSRILATRDENNNITLEIFDGQVLPPKISDLVQKMKVSTLDSVTEDSTLKVADGITLGFDEDDDSHTRFKLTDEEDEEEYYITPYVLRTVQYYGDSLARLPVHEPTMLSMDMDLHFDRHSRKWISSQVIMSNSVIRDINATSDSVINSLKPGEELRFGPEKKIPIDIHGRYQVRYRGRYNTEENLRTFQHLSYYDVLTNRVDPISYQGKIFILGSAAQALFDFVPGPHEENYPAVLIHATIFKNVLEDDYIVTLGEHWQQIIVILLTLICAIIGLFLKSYFSISISIIIMLLYILIAYWCFQAGIYIGVAKQMLAILLTNIVGLVVQFYFENKEKSFINKAFKQYISPQLIDDMVNKEIMPTLGGVKSNITAYFTDIASFSTFSEKIGDPKKLVDLLNEYLTAMTDTLLSNKGTLDKYEGDAIIAFFGAPAPLENHAQSACYSAVDMQRKLMGLRKKWALEGDKWPKVVQDMHMRIGINSGDIVTGNMGSKTRKNYTMMGDAVNLAARLESAAKQYGAYIQISEDTQKHLEDGRFIYRSLDIIRVVGKSQPVKTFELLEKSSAPNADALRKLVSIWEKARSCYQAMKWDEAIDLFTQCLELEPHLPEHDPGSKTCPSLVYIKRCTEYKQNPPVAEGETWDGVFTATEK